MGFFDWQESHVLLNATLLAIKKEILRKEFLTIRAHPLWIVYLLPVFQKLNSHLYNARIVSCLLYSMICMCDTSLGFGN